MTPDDRSECRWDLHIHSMLSPCADDDMTPNNIVNMALVAGLSGIALTDHNTALNCPAVEEVARNAGLGFVAGIELSTAEDIHLLCYFKNTESALAFSEYIRPLLPDTENKANIYGNQFVADSSDKIVSIVRPLLINACDISLERAVRQVKNYGGTPVPAHVDKPANSIFAVLGSFPQALGCDFYEPFDPLSVEALPAELREFLPDRPIISSDAHRLWEIGSRFSRLPPEHAFWKAVGRSGQI